jgi:hypothetical protein
LHDSFLCPSGILDPNYLSHANVGKFQPFISQGYVIVHINFWNIRGTWDVGRGTWDVGLARTNRSSVDLGVSLLQEVANVPVAVVAADTVPLFLLSHLLLRWWQIGALHR